MLKKTITYTDYNGVERTEDFMFNLNKAELTELTTTDGYVGYLQNIVDAQDTRELIKVMKDLIVKSYGEKSLDGRQFEKVDGNGVPLSRKFTQTEAYSVMYMELATNTDAAVAFVIGIMPKDLQEQAAALDAKNIAMAANNVPVVNQ